MSDGPNLPHVPTRVGSEVRHELRHDHPASSQVNSPSVL